MPTDKPDIEDITSSSATVNWPNAKEMTAGLEDKYYNYIVWLKADGENEKNVTHVSQDGAKGRMESRLTGLKFNTYYTVRVEPYRQHNGIQEAGKSTGVTRFKTNCTGNVLHNNNNNQ